jgi:hypothetical protein
MFKYHNSIRFDSATVSYIMWFFSISCIGVYLGFFLDRLAQISSTHRKILRYERPENSAHSNQNLFERNDNELIQWILEEAPICDPADDGFEHKIPAKRIARLLLQDSPSNIGVVGPYGSGKSSLLNLVEYYLNQNHHFSTSNKSSSTELILCRIDGWGRVSGSVAQKILGLAIEKVRTHLDCAAILSLPENYRKAIAGAKTGSGTILASLLQVSHDPISQLSKLDNILEAAKFRIVIFLEDLDRNISDEIIRDELPALLDRLRLLKQVSFVLSIGSERQFSNILIRICDHLEAIS